MSSLLVLQNAPGEDLGILAPILTGYGLECEYVRTFAGQEVPPDLGRAAALVVLGGPMGVYERQRYPFLDGAMRLIEQALKSERPLLGICLGSQLLAAVLGASVRRGERREIGWHPVELNSAARNHALWAGVESRFMAYHWHGDLFDLPPGAAALASSAQTPLQAFSCTERAFGVLFHMEVTEKIVADMVRDFADELRQEALDGAAIAAAAAEHLPALQRNGRAFFAAWAALCLEAA